MSGLEVIGGAAAILQLVQTSDKQVENIVALAKSFLPASPQASLVEEEARSCMEKAQAFGALFAKWRLEAPKDGNPNLKSKILAAIKWQPKEREITSRWKELDASMRVLHFAATAKQLAEERTPVKVYSAAQSPTTMPLVDSTLPPRNPRFVGQKAILLEVERKLQLVNRIALVGIGGTGKSQLAIEFAHRIRECSRQVWILFASAESELHLEQSYSRFAIDAKLATSDAPLLSQCQAVKDFLESSSAGRWLMIIDGVDDAKVFYGILQFITLLPHSAHGSIIFTSRNLDVVRNFVRNEDYVVRLNRLSPKDAVKLFQDWLEGSHVSKFHAEDVLELIETLNGLPLALTQAASYIDRNCDSVSEYIRWYHGSEAEKIFLLSEGGLYDDKSIEYPVAKTWLIPFDRIQQEYDFAAHLLCFAACLHHRRIPLNVLPENQDEVKLGKALGVLKAHCMIVKEPFKNIFDMQSMVHLMTRHWLRSRNQLQQYANLAFNAIHERFPSVFRSQQEISWGNQYSTHAQALLSDLLFIEYGECHAELASRLSRYLCVKGNHAIALPYLQQAIDLSKAIYGQQETQTLTKQSEMAVINLYLGEYQEAERLATYVRDIRTEMLGNEHPETLAIQNNLALIYHAQGNHTDTESLQRQTYKTRERTLGLSHEETLKGLNNLGLALKRLSELEEAEQAFRTACKERLNTRSEVDLDLLRVMNNLGLVLELRGKLKEALDWHRKTLDGIICLFGSNHLESFRSKQNIAGVLTSQHEYEEAEATMREVIQGYINLSLSGHPDFFFAQQRLVDVLKARGKYNEAKSTCLQILKARKAKLGKDHPETVFSQSQWEELVSTVEELTELPELD